MDSDSEECPKRRFHSEETKAKISATKTGRRHSEETKAKISAARRRRGPISEETRAKMSKAHRDRALTPISEETRQKLREGWQRTKGSRFVPAGWNKSLTKETDPRVARGAVTLSQTLQRQVAEGTFVVHPASPETRRKMSASARARGAGGHISKNAIWYRSPDGKEVWLQSSYELKVAQDLDDKGVWWVRPEPLLWVDPAGITRRYYPDFYIPSLDIYLDPKNSYLIQKDRAKIEAVSSQNGVKILVLDVEHLTWEKIKAKSEQ